jgi:hypothetical protein
LEWKILVYFTAFLVFSWPSIIFCVHLVYLVAIGNAFSGSGMLQQEQSGNPVLWQRPAERF